MKFTSAAFGLALAAGANAHAIMQELSVNGANQGQLVGLRAPSSNYPVQNVQSADMVCGTSGTKSSSVITVPAGATVRSRWGHVIGGAQYNPDPDNPIAASHKGPIQVYIAKVDNAASASQTGLSWVKVWSEGVSSSGVWAVDKMIQGAGWYTWTLPSCIAPGQYLIRTELIALHSAYSAGGAQFYISCAQLSVTGSGTVTPSGGVSFPGAYVASDPGIQLSIYDGSGNPTAGGNYKAPGPAVLSCSGAPPPPPPPVSSARPASTTLRTSTTTRASSAAPTPTGGAGTVAKYQQCGGIGYTGATGCVSGSTCTKVNDYYFQCL